jgi:hypothetical protein
VITIKSPREIELMARAGRIVADVLALVRSRAVPGISTWQLDLIAEEFIRSHAGATPSFNGLYGFPATLCTSINAEVVHGIPSKKRILAEGDILSVDVGACIGGLHADGALTAIVGEVSPAARKLLLKPIHETALVYQGRVRMTREITFGAENTLKPLVSPSGEVALKGSLRYQACDDRECYPPETAPVEWKFRFEALDRERVPTELQRTVR